MMVGNFLKKIVGTSNDRVLKSMRGDVLRINDLDRTYEPKTDDQLRNCISDFKVEVEKGRPLDEILPDVFAIVRQASIRTLEMRHFDVQLIGGMVLHQGKIAEMKTGEGKTLSATLPAVLNAITGKGVHIVTVNDYLARRDAEWMSKIYNFLGMSAGVVYSGMDEAAKKAAYAADITYGQNNEFGFDYLRDNMKFHAQDLMQRGHHFAIVDEVDSILVDEARTPLIISGPAEDSSELYFTINKIIPNLKEGAHYEVDLKSKQPTLNEDGIAKVEELLEIDNLYDPNNIEVVHHTNQGLKAHTTMTRDVDYVVKDGGIIIVDEFTGRLMPGRRWSDGLHQAIEAKEGLRIARENQTLASITFQNLFRLYEKLSGMTGTAATEAVEFKEIYKLDVVVMPTNKPLLRDDQSDVVFRTREEKYQGVADDIKEINKTGQPILVGTISIEQSESLAKALSKEDIEHNVLNAKQHAREADIVAQAGRLKAVTIATNMAGRGTDILLGGNPEKLAADEVGSSEGPEFEEAFQKYKEICAREKEEVLEAGGLFIMGTERHESRRIDNQLRGRAGRQGDPGVSRFYVSLEDDLMKRFGGERIQGLMDKLGWEEGAAMDGRMISRSIEGAQKKVERFHFESRKNVTEYDDVMNKQRQVIYNLRNRVLRQDSLKDEIISMIDDLLEDAVLAVCDEKKKPLEWDFDELKERCEFLFNTDAFSTPQDTVITQQSVFDHLREQIKEHYQKHAEYQDASLQALRAEYDDKIQIAISESSTRAFDFKQETFEQETLLEAIDKFWLQHLQEMDHLREGIGLRGYGQKNPKHEYQREGFLLFTQMLDRLKESVVRKLCYANAAELEEILKHIAEEQARRAAMEEQMKLTHEGAATSGSESVSGEDEEDKDPDAIRQKLAQQKRARRRKKKKK
jgi:preprotein translocase subunit SecA